MPHVLCEWATFVAGTNIYLYYFSLSHCHFELTFMDVQACEYYW